MKGQSPKCSYKPGVLSINSNFVRPFVTFKFSCFSWEQCLSVHNQMGSVRAHLPYLCIELRHNEWANYNFIEKFPPYIQSKFIFLLEIFSYIFNLNLFFGKFFSHIFSINLFCIGNFFLYIQSNFLL